MDKIFEITTAMEQRGLTQAEYNKLILELQDEIPVRMETLDLPVVNQFCDNTYMRTLFMPAGTIVIGKTHKTQHFNIVHTGKALVMMNGEIKLVEAPDMFISEAGVKKVFRVLEDMNFTTVHPIKKRDLVMNNGLIDIEATEKRLERKLILSFTEEREQIEREYRGQLCHGQQ